MKLRATFNVLFILFLCLLVSFSAGSYIEQQNNKDTSSSLYGTPKENKTEHGLIHIQFLISKILKFDKNKTGQEAKFKSERPFKHDGFEREHNQTSTAISKISPFVMDSLSFQNKTQRILNNKTASRLKRKRRYNYEDTFDWEEDDQLLEYDVDEDSTVQKIGRHWKKVAASICFVSAGIILACICGRIAWVVCYPKIKDACYMTYCPLLHCLYKEYELMCKDDGDQLERDFRTVANMLGIRLTLEDFQAIKEHYGFDGGKHIQDFDSAKSAAKKYDVDMGLPTFG